MRLALVFVATLLGCSSPSSEPDASIDAGFPVEAPTPPAEPQPVVLTPCPPGWQEVSGTVTGCEPWPVEMVSSCAIDEARFPGGAGCERVGTACTSDEWPTLPANRPVLYVRSGAAAGGDGSRSNPFGTLTEAVPRALSTPESIIALSKGQHLSIESLPANTTVWGACVAETVLTVPSTPTTAEAQSKSPGVEVRNLRVTGRRPGLMSNGAGAELTVRDVIIDGATGIGWGALAQGRSNGDHVVIRNTQPTSTGTLGKGVDVLSGGEVRGAFVVVENSTVVAAEVQGAGSKLHLEDFALRDTHTSASGEGGHGVYATDGTVAELVRGVVDRTDVYGVNGTPGAVLSLTDVLLRELPGTTNGTLRAGVFWHDANLTAQRVVASGHSGFGFTSIGDAGVAVLGDVMVENAGRPNAPSQTGALRMTGVVSLSRGFFRGNQGGVQLSNGVFVLNDVVVTETHSPNVVDDKAFFLFNKARVTLTRASVVRNDGFGVVAEDCTLEASDVRLEDTGLAEVNSTAGQALLVRVGAQVTLSRVAIVRARSTGLLMGGGGVSVVANDLVIDDTRDVSAEHAFGAGIMIAGDARLQGTRVSITRNVGVGVWATNAGSVAELSELTVRHTQRGSCSAEPCASTQPVGLLSFKGGALRASRFFVSDNVGYGAVVSEGDLDLHDGEIANHVIGVNVSDANFDLGRVSSGVVFTNNERKLDAVVVPLPQLPALP